MKQSLLTTVVLVMLSATAVKAQMLLTSTTYNQNFNAIGNASNAPLPTGWKIAAISTSTAIDYSLLQGNTTVAYGNTGTGSVTANSAGGAVNWADGSTADSPDRAIGFLNATSFASGKSIEFAFTNNTGSTISDLTFSWDYEKYRNGTRGCTWSFYVSKTGGVDPSTWTENAAGRYTYQEDPNNLAVYPATFAGIFVSQSNVNLDQNATLYLRWTLQVNGGNNGQGLAIDNFSLVATTIPEPSPAPLLGLSLCVCALGFRHLRRRIA